MEDHILTLGPTISAWLSYRSINQSKLAISSGLDLASLNKMVNGKRSSIRSRIILERIAESLRITPEIILLGLTPDDLITPDLPNAATLADTNGGIEVLLAIYFLKIARTKDARFWLEKPK